ncbi:MAG: DUF2624 family protein [Erysipelotrichales bacterium]|nr:DUF2624 family protein [Erysipelotrichales bacterium]
MNNIITKYVSIMKKEDIINFANKNNLKVTNSEVDFIYTFIKNNFEHYLKNPESFDITQYKNRFSPENYEFLVNLVNKYKRMIF